jgi:predicted permease
LGVRALVGRLFNPDDDAPGKKPVAVISYTYWQRRFASDPSVLGRTIYVGRVPFVVIGVTSPRFFGRNTAGVSADIVLPMEFQRELGLKDHDTFEIMGRLMPDVTSEQARADLTVVYQQELMRQAGTQNSRQTDLEVGAQKIVLTPAAHGTSLPTDDFSSDMRILAAVVGVALLIACVNVAGLLVARGSGRRKEIAIRQAIGASRERLIRQLLVESFVLAGLGGLLGLLFANWGASLLLGLLVTDGSPLPQAGLDLWTVGFTVAASLLTGLFFGLGPAFIGTRVGLNAVLKGSDEPAGSRGNSGRGLAISQVALSLSLLIGAGLLLRSLQHLYEVQTGFEREAVVQTWVFPVLSGFGHAQEMALYPRLVEKFSAIPGVRSASVSRLRMIYGHWYRDVWTHNTGADARESRQVYCDPVGPRFFETMGIPLVGGREFSVADTQTSTRVAIISESMAKRFFPEGNPIGRRFRFDAQPGNGEVEVVGVVRDIKHRMDSAERPESAWIPYTQVPSEMLGQMNFLIRTEVAPASIVSSLREQARSVAANLPLVGVETQAAEVDEYLAGRRSMATLLSAFAALALGLASIGLYGTISYSVRARTRELGIRFALGAQRSEILWMVLRETLGLTAIGMAIGVPLALGGTRLVASMLFGVKGTDATTISLTVLVMCAATALLAGYLPARRATRVDPLVALRYE